MNYLLNNYRYEIKFLLSSNMAKLLKYKLNLIMKKDYHSKSKDGKYYIRSLYFDDIYDTAYHEKLDGLNIREKYRIRYYDFDESYISIELKGKKGDLSYKKQNKITKEEYFLIINKNYDKININNRKILEEFIDKCKYKNLVPSVIVDYERLAYTYQFEDVRITFDENIKSGLYNYNIFNKHLEVFDVLEPNQVILEVKFNNKLPNILNDIIRTVPMVRIAMSKFALCKEKKEVYYDNYS